ncbi:M56/M15 family metallopeptidase [Winogradskyella psychrotolerans]|uniref:M56/M15 family metallopeptidase n=1 Tax=Winogradskyella psychrotolerans TaxID=1344585 RepID=UPI001C07D524|nr:M56/M15 family metallopeptidase [Winogradskyella psychrotolerans]MBU2929665.1 N-acetylmuramoyl-L-alanine amidase [Winogradskyella psychrotolerans]
MISYFIYTMISLGCSYAVYVLLLRRQKTFQFNRFFLLSALVLCLAAPFIEFELFKAVPSITQIPLENFTKTDILIDTVESIEIGEEVTVTSNRTHPITIIYITISLLLFVRFLKNLFQLYRLTRANFETIGKLKVIKTSDSDMVASFFNYMFLPSHHNLPEDDVNSIVAHETVHSKELHTLDIILLEFLSCVFWLNPFIWLYKKAILQNHEFIADEKSVSSGIDIENYSNTIINLGQKDYRVPLTSGFNFIQIKNRIIMLHQSKSSVLNRTLKITSVIFLFSGIFALSSCKDLDDTLSTEPLVVVIDAGHGGKDSGHFSEHEVEKTIILQITNLLASLSNDKVEIVLTRNNDKFVELSERADFINNIQPNLFLSLHCNAHSDASISGTEAYFNPKLQDAETSLKYADVLIKHQLDNFASRGVKEASGFYLLKNTTVPGVYLELGFLTNERDRVVLTDKREQLKIAKSIYEGLLEIRNSK